MGGAIAIAALSTGGLVLDGHGSPVIVASGGRTYRMASDEHFYQLGDDWSFTGDPYDLTASGRTWDIEAKDGKLFGLFNDEGTGTQPAGFYVKSYSVE